MNWGKKLIAGMILFMVFIVSLGAIMIMQNGKDNLVENDYYEKGQLYDLDYKAKKRAIDDNVVPEIEVNKYGVTISFRLPMKYKIICKRPSDSLLDRVFSGYTEEDRCVELSKSQLKTGPWQLRIEYSFNNRYYLFEKEIKIP